MRWIDRMEGRFGWMAFPGFLRHYAILHALVFLLQIVRPDIGLLLEFDRDLILKGELWRVLTFLFASSGFTGIGAIGMLFFFFMVLIAFMMSNALEGAWGVFRTTLFFYAGVLGLIIGNFLVPNVMFGSGFLLYEAAFFAFATLFPRTEFMLFLIIPVQVRWLAWILAVLMLLGALGQFFDGNWLVPVFYLLAFTNYLLWAGIPALRGRARLVQAAQRRRSFESAREPADKAFHQCAQCGRTEQSDPLLEFRISADGKEYCLEHLPERED